MGLALLRAGLAATLLFAVAGNAAAGERTDLETLFEAEGVNGTFVLFDVEKDELTAVDAERAERRFPPASTFKIANSLIALETGAVADVDEVLPYGGKPQPFKQWERDMSLRKAIAVSNVPVYQEVARRIGLERMKEMLSKLDYGNRDPGTVVDRFWLDGPLEISANEQARFVTALATNTLPLSNRSQEMVREILLMEEIGGAKLYGKTGWLFHDDEVDIGWFVGWVEREGKIYSFALNIDMDDKEQVGLRVPLAKKLLRELDVL
ncbi:Beta-lactamase [Parvibaculum lavamentivorans DS-1]|uniref:Beta-lactamase n=1 Tax=Parvibaculum lavamentivorans (strain DS-1 / DSM 13023 / NCIMB 13966) TaxID=402881 RepID=A7HXJ0_PARL1|nr:class D beta-lactamase [Parvibaculum lavamentivorans]ABS64623.1 Beta-lactamase [Parvibaculum lavamentivorans DS-1]